MHLYYCNVNAFGSEFLQLCCYAVYFEFVCSELILWHIIWKWKVKQYDNVEQLKLCLHTFAFICVDVKAPKAGAVIFCVDLSEDVTMVICPGIGNHSEKHYIRTFVDYSQKQGYRCAVLNHLGALPNIELTSPRMFTYGTRQANVFIQ